MKLKRILGAGLAAAIFNIIFGAVTCGGLFSCVYALEPTNVWKPMGGSGPGADFLIGMLILSLVLAYVYALINRGIPGKNRFIKGLVFGIIVWAIGLLPGMLATYAFMTVAPAVVVYWTIMGLIEIPLKGLIIAAIYGE
ncbi:MAG: hypothetical protein HGA87_04885 [Desulfobulbaceae bacterium]|nr:hypothetical protein [Desulfobulbaceae bacterium]